MEHDDRRDGAWAAWETDADDYQAVLVPGAGVFAEVKGSTHQAMWIATREQVRARAALAGRGHPA